MEQTKMIILCCLLVPWLLLASGFEAALPQELGLDSGIRDIYSQKSWLQEVIPGARAVMANGGVIAPVGLNMVALAAQGHAVPFVVLAGSHKVYRGNNNS